MYPVPRDRGGGGGWAREEPSGREREREPHDPGGLARPGLYPRASGRRAGLVEPEALRYGSDYHVSRKQ